MDIRSYIKNNNMTFQDMAERCKTSRRQLYSLMEGKDVTLSVLLRIIVGTDYQITFEDLCGYMKKKELGYYFEKGKRKNNKEKNEK